MKTIVNILLISVIMFSCGVKKTDRTQEKVSETTTPVLKFEPREQVRSINTCKPGESTCSYIKLNYIEAVDGTVKDKINKLIMNELMTAYDMPDKNLGNVKLMMETFIKDNEGFKKQYPDAWSVWTVDYVAKIYSETEKILCLSFFNSNYLGGAHPNTYTIYRNISKETGDTLTLSDLLGRGFEKKLNALIDKKYREERGLQPGDNLAEKGDLFENKITFNYNFAVWNDKRMEFYYNAYEIAPYVVGPITIMLEAQDIASIITGSSPLK